MIMYASFKYQFKKLFITNPTEYVVSIYITEHLQHLPISEKHCIL